MANFNKVLLMGNLTRDPEVRYTPKGTAIANIGLAVNRAWTNENGEKKEEVTFVDVEVWGRQAETAGQYLSKGRPVFIEGRLRLDSWEDKESGQKRNKLKVVAERVQFLGAPRASAEFSDQPPGGDRPVETGNPQRGAPRSARPAAAAPAAESEESPPTEDDNIPF
jgi:single-strand DNA-binding protein